jgi:hypothetical protein
MDFIIFGCSLRFSSGDHTPTPTFQRKSNVIFIFLVIVILILYFIYHLKLFFLFSLLLTSRVISMIQ